ncbi:small integral membrane protein 1 [Chanos chanos]|uniref:Small integral membrane protein 1 n=1 Tax=Chanos chanos TaxID=29144 RepID=A0A6J2WB59_CHACN|nr:small integral membrane protein 1 [Chanos chanos]
MESSDASVQYNRWDNDNVNLNVSSSQSSFIQFYNRLCTGELGIAMRVLGSLTVMAAMYIIGYITGYYVHRC